MSKYCAKCGKEMNETAKFCPACGAKAATPVTRQPEMAGQTGTLGQNVNNAGTSSEQAPAQNMNLHNGQGTPVTGTAKKTSTGKIVVAVVAGLILIVGMTFLGKKIMTPGYEKPVKQLEQAINEVSYSKMKDAMAPGVIDNLMGEYSWIMSYIDDEKIDEYMQEALEESGLGGDDEKVTLKVTDKERIKADDLSSELSNNYGVDDSDASNATDAYNLQVKIGTKSSDAELSSMQIIVIKIDGKWKLASIPF